MEWTIGHYILFITMVLGLFFWVGLTAIIFLRPKKTRKRNFLDDVQYPKNPVLELPPGVTLPTKQPS